MGSKSFRNTHVFFNDYDLGFFKEVVINQNEARFYNPDLIKVASFDNFDFDYDSLSDSTDIEFYGEDDALIEYFIERKKPNHYYHNGIMAWDIIDRIMDYYGNEIDGSLGFYLGNIFKYLLRFKFKGQAQSDLEKIKIYVDRIIEYVGLH